MNLTKPFEGIPKGIWLLAGINFINRVGGMIMCFLSLYITQSLGYGIKEAGYAMAIYGVGAIAGQYIGGRLTDKLGFHTVQLASLISTGVFILAVLQVKEFYTLCTLLFILNMVSEAFRPANSVAISVNSNTEIRTKSFSLMRMSFNLAITLALTIGGLLIMMDWSFIFWADAITCFIAAIALYFFLPVAYRHSPKNRTQEANDDNPNFSIFQDKEYLLFTFITFLGALSFMQIVWTVPQFFKTIHHWNEFYIGCISAVNGFVVMLTEMAIVHRIENRLQPVKIIKIGLFIYAFSYILLMIPAPFHLIGAILYMVFISFGEIFVMPFSITWATLRAPKNKEGKYMSAYGMAYAIAHIIAPLMGTQIIYYLGYNALWISIVAISVVAALLNNLLPSIKANPIA